MYVVKYLTKEDDKNYKYLYYENFTDALYDCHYWDLSQYKEIRIYDSHESNPKGVDVIEFRKMVGDL